MKLLAERPLFSDQILIVILSFRIGYVIGKLILELNTGSELLTTFFDVRTNPLALQDMKGCTDPSNNGKCSAFITIAVS
jgi:hypothetical protein